MAKERVQKIIASVGLCSRRTAEEWIEQGLVTVNGEKIKLGDRAELGVDAIKVKGKLLQTNEAGERVYLAFNKPKGVISMVNEDPEGRPTLKDYLKHVKQRVFPIGRLEFNQEGLVLLTNDGAFAEKLRVNPKILRIYRIKVAGHVVPDQLAQLRKPMKMEGKLIETYSAKIIEKLSQKTLLEVAFEGMGAIDVKEFMMRRGFLVDRMVLHSVGHMSLAGIPVGHYKHLKKTQVDAMTEQPELAHALLSEENAHAVAELEEGAADAAAEASEEAGASAEEHAPVRRPARGRDRSSEDGFDRPKRSYGDRPQRGFGSDRAARGPRREYGDRPARGPRREYGDRPARSEGGFDRPKRSFGGPKRDFGDRPKRSFGGPKREFGGDRPARGPRREYGDRPQRSEGGFDRPKRTFGEKRSFGGPKRDFGDRPKRGPRRDGGSGFGGLRLRKKRDEE